MHATLLTILLATGAQLPSVDGQRQLAMDSEDCRCTACNRGECRAGWLGCGVFLDCLAVCCGPMPQTCYAPRLGCYPGNNRCMQRYPAFHGSYYRQAYNYRHLFDYPWHATPHQPQGFFTYRGSSPLRPEEEIPTPRAEPAGVPPAALPSVPGVP